MRTNIIVAAAISLATLSVYWNVQYFTLVNMDDPLYVIADPRVAEGVSGAGILRAFTQTYIANWHPLTTLSYMIDTSVYGKAPGGYHLTSLLLHLINTTLLFAFLVRATGARWPSAFVVALFALHPCHVESVAWVSGRKDVLSALFMFLMLLAYARYATSPDRARFAPVWIAFLGALMSKPISVTMPFVLLLLDYWPLRRSSLADLAPFQRATTLVKEKAILFAFVAVSVPVTYYAANAGGAVRTLSETPLITRVGGVPLAYAGYMAQLVWPFELVPGGYSTPKSPNVLLVVAALTLVIAITGVAVRLRAAAPYFIVGWLWFLGMLVPVIGIVSIGSTYRADRYTYVSEIGLYIAIAWGVPRLIERLKQKRIVLVWGAAGIVAVFAGVTWAQVQVWQDGKTLFTEKLRVDPGNYQALFALASVYEEEGDFARAIEYFQKAHESERSNVESVLKVADIYRKSGNPQAAITLYRQVTETDPTQAGAFLGLGLSYAKLGNVDEAERYIREALRIRPDYEAAQKSLETLR